MRFSWQGKRAWARRGILLACGLAAIVLSEIPSIAQFAGGKSLGPLIFRALGSAGLVFALIAEYIASWQHTDEIRRELHEEKRRHDLVSGVRS